MSQFVSVVRWIARESKRVAVTVVGVALVLVGIPLLPLPGPGILVILAGLAVLATQYAWARSALDETKKAARWARDRARKRKRKEQH